MGDREKQDCKNEDTLVVTPEEHAKAERIASALFELDPEDFEEAAEHNSTAEETSQ